MPLQLQRRWRLVRSYLLLGLGIGLAYGVLSRWPVTDLGRTLLVSSATGLGIGGLLGLSEVFLLSEQFRRRPFATLVLARALLYTLLVVGWSLLVDVAASHYFTGLGYGAALRQHLASRQLLADAGFSLLFCLLVVAALQVSSLHGPGELRKFVLGTYHQPREVERVFLFIDLTASTTLAEELGNLAYSRLVRDFYFDLTDALLLTQAEVYQYVGDEVVLSWPLALGLRQGRCVRCFYALQRTLAARRAYYLAEYGHCPAFKAGLHGGPVVVTWVGEVKREIVYHGDVLNTAARLLGLCHELGQELLASDFIVERLGPLPGLAATPLGSRALRGRQHETRLYGLREQPPAPA